MRFVFWSARGKEQKSQLGLAVDDLPHHLFQYVYARSNEARSSVTILSNSAVYVVTSEGAAM
jgi:hypothetical protein